VAIQFGSGEPVSRLRRSLDVKGKLNLGVDETIVPVLTIFDSTQPPFRRTGVRWFFHAGIGPIAAERGRLRIFNNSTIDQLIDRISVSSPSGSGVIFAQVGQGPSGEAPALPVRTTEIVEVDAGGVIARQIPILTFADTVFPTSLSTIFWTMSWDADNTIPGLFELPIVLPASPLDTPITNLSTLTVECDKVNQQIDVSVSGLYWDSLPLNART